MNLIDRYIIASVAGGALLVLAVIVALSSFLMFVGQFDDIGVGRYGKRIKSTRAGRGRRACGQGCRHRRGRRGLCLRSAS